MMPTHDNTPEDLMDRKPDTEMEDGMYIVVYAFAVVAFVVALWTAVVAAK